MAQVDNVKAIMAAVRSILSNNGFTVSPIPTVLTPGKFAVVTFFGLEHYTFNKNPAENDIDRHEVDILLKITNPSADLTASEMEETTIEDLVMIEAILSIAALNSAIGYTVVTNIDFLKSGRSDGINLNRFMENQLLKIRYTPTAVP